MSTWSIIKNSIKNNVRTLEYFVNDVGNAVAFVPEIFGTVCYDAFLGLGEKTGAKTFFCWLGSIIKNSCSILGAVIKGIFGISAAALGSVIKITGGILTAQSPIIFQGFWDLISPVMGSIILILGKFIALVQSLFFLQDFERPLSESEKNVLRKIFQRSMNLYLIRIIEGRSGIFGVSPRAFTLGNTLYLKTNSFPTSLLVHECSHSWQYHHTGNRYTADAIGAQWFVDDAYNWFKEIDLRKKTNWFDFNPEAQAEFLEDIWKHGCLVNKDESIIDYGKGSFYNADDENSFGKFEAYGNNLTDIANQALHQIRKRW